MPSAPAILDARTSDTTPRPVRAPARAVTGPRSWIALLVLLIACGAVFGLVDSTSSSSAPATLPAEAESQLVADELATFPDADLAPVIGVATRVDGGQLTQADLDAFTQARERMIAVDRGPGTENTADAENSDAADPGAVPPVPLPTDDGEAATILVPVSVDVDGGDLADIVEKIRSEGRNGLPADLSLLVTGGPAFGADTAGAFAGADLRLILVSAAVVAVLLLITYRSPILWVVPLLVVAVADRVATLLAGAFAGWLGYAVDGSTNGITSVLVFGAGTNYALLIVSRYREELRREPDHRVALGRALQAATPAVLASNITVVLALATLMAAIVPSTRLLGLSAAVGLLVALVIVLVGLPTLLSLCGRRLFWPFVPRFGDPDPSERGGWHAVASAVVRRPLIALAVTLPFLALCAAGLTHTEVGLEQSRQFRVQAESVEGLDALREHQDPGEVTPTNVLATTPDEAAVADTLEVITNTPGVLRANPSGQEGDRTSFRVVLDAEPASDEALQAVQSLRDRLGQVEGAQARVGGGDAEQLDSRAASERDLFLLVPLILGVVVVVLYVLLRGAWAPLLLITATSVSTIAAIGAGSWLSAEVFGFPALDVSVPLFSVLFLIALGVDYTIFLVTRAWEESVDHGTRQGTVRAVALTGGVITSAGVVLAAVFVVLGVLPLITLTQIGIIVGIGILLDTFVVRTIVVPAMIGVIGDAFWWPRRPGRAREAARREEQEPALT
ncbi:MMPL family transporter [Mobilicoccus caccae]|uniref:Membrane protein n=1 Tax=Mobilicoccus caccae TaxID=1859295 RepID=A0ABQ6ILV8_9MICO|nr:MMPL family transporter [Mobilicoccus caccae]GMA38421.1 membrane protein [Mobilicoccus caccae]